MSTGFVTRGYGIGRRTGGADGGWMARRYPGREPLVAESGGNVR